MNKEIEKLNLPVKYSDIEKAYKCISNYIVKTRLLKANHLSKIVNADVFIKPENMQQVKSFKIRGALNKVFSLTSDQKAKGVIAPSAGNHAQGVALASTLLGVKSNIVMPKTVPLEKLEATKGFGGNVILADGQTFDDALELTNQLQKEHDYTYVHPFDDEWVIAGQGTIGYEILRELPEVDMIICPVGGGGLISGIAIAAKSVNPDIEIVGVEPSSFNCLQQSLEKNEKFAIKTNDITLADGTAVKKVGNMNFDICKKLVDRVVSVDEWEIKVGIAHLAEKCKIIAEGAGALGTAALISNKIPNVKNKKIVNIISGGNIDADKLINAMECSLNHNGRRMSLLINLNQENLKDFIDVINNNKAKAYSFDGSVITDLFVPYNNKNLIIVYTKGPEEKKNLLKGLIENNFIFDKFDRDE